LLLLFMTRSFSRFAVRFPVVGTLERRALTNKPAF